MKLHLDCDVILDVALNRQGFADASSFILDWAKQNPGRVSVAWHSLANLTYMCKTDSRPFIKALCEFVEIPSSGNAQISMALELKMKDFEDAMQVAVAHVFGAQLIVTRNVKDYKRSPIKAVTPLEWLEFGVF